MGKVHTFQDQLATGSLGEAVVDAAYGQWHSIELVAMDDQRRGVDRVYTLPSGERLEVEVKTDTQAMRTGRVFIETVSNDRRGKPGWVFTCEADALVYYMHREGGGRALVFRPGELRGAVYGWLKGGKVKAASNPGYHSYGVLVPERLAATMASGTLDVATGEATGLLAPEGAPAEPQPRSV